MNDPNLTAWYPAGKTGELGGSRGSARCIRHVGDQRRIIKTVNVVQIWREDYDDAGVDAQIAMLIGSCCVAQKKVQGLQMLVLLIIK